jgi:hypothetical protein
MAEASVLPRASCASWKERGLLLQIPLQMQQNGNGRTVRVARVALAPARFGSRASRLGSLIRPMRPKGEFT